MANKMDDPDRRQRCRGLTPGWATPKVGTGRQRHDQARSDALPPGSCLALSHLTDKTAPPELRDQVRTCIDLYQNSASPLVARTRATLSRWLEGLELVPPGVTIANQWNPDGTPRSGPNMTSSSPASPSSRTDLHRRDPVGFTHRWHRDSDRSSA